MSCDTQCYFSPRAGRVYDHDAVDRFPWPVVICYRDIHRWMDDDQPVHAAWQVRDAWEALLRFLGSLAIADHLAAVKGRPPQTRELLSILLDARGLSMGHWFDLLRLAYKDASADISFAALRELLFPASGRSTLLPLFNGGDHTESFIPWRNRRFGHGVLGRDLEVFARESVHWLGKLHRAYDICRWFLQSVELEVEGLNSTSAIMSERQELSFYHGHLPDAGSPVLAPVRIRTEEAVVDLSPLLSVQSCVVCGRWSGFYFDKFRSKQQHAFFLDVLDGHSNPPRKDDRLSDWSAWAHETGAAAASAAPVDPAEPAEPAQDRFSDFVGEFQPPRHLAQEVSEFLSSHDRGVILLSGPAGVGKSWLLEGLDRHDMLPAFQGRDVNVLTVSLHRHSGASASDMKARLGQQAKQQKQWRIPVEPDAPTAHERFAGWLAALMRVNGVGELIVGIDGLDELPADSNVPDLFPPADSLPRSCYLLVSSRHAVRAAAEAGLRRVRSAAGHCKDLTIDPATESHREVLCAYAQRRLARLRTDAKSLPDTWARPLVEKAEGIFLYVHHFCQALHFGIYSDLDGLPRPNQYYPQFFAHLRNLVGVELFDQHYAPVLALIAVAREPIGVSHLAAWRLARSRLIPVLDDLADLLRGRREPWDSETLYSLGHDEIREFLATDPEWKKRLEEANQLMIRLTETRFRGRWSEADVFDPVEGYMLMDVLDYARPRGERAVLLADRSLAEAISDAGTVLFQQGRLERALQATAIAIALREYQVAESGQDDLRGRLAHAHCNRALVLDALGRAPEALPQYETGIGLLGAMACEAPAEDVKRSLAWARMNFALALASIGRETEALAEYDQCIELLKPLVAADPNSTCRSDLARVYLNRSAVRSNPSRLADCNRCVDFMETLFFKEAQASLRASLAKAYLARGNATLVLGGHAMAKRDYEAAIGLIKSRSGGGSGAAPNPDLASAHYQLAIAENELRQWDVARANYSSAIEVLHDLVEQHGSRWLIADLARAYLGRAEVWRALEQPDDALKDLEESINRLRQIVAAGSTPSHASVLGRALVLMAELLLAKGLRPEARETAMEAIKILRTESPRCEPMAVAHLAHYARRVFRDASRNPLYDSLLRFARRLLGA